MFGPPGHAYVYLVYGLHNCLNVVVGEEGMASAVLIRAVEPRSGVAAMRAAADAARRPRSRQASAGSPTSNARLADMRLASGPGRLGAAFGIDRSFDGLDLCSPDAPLRLLPPDEPVSGDVVATPRIGVAYAGEPWADAPWRLIVSGSAAVSGGGRARRAEVAP